MRTETLILPDDEINIMFDRAESCGWKKWGKFYKKKGSSYQCFRKGNNYIWIGFAYIQHSDYSIAIDYRAKFKREKDEEMIKKMLE